MGLGDAVPSLLHPHDQERLLVAQQALAALRPAVHAEELGASSDRQATQASTSGSPAQPARTPRYRTVMLKISGEALQVGPTWDAPTPHP